MHNRLLLLAFWTLMWWTTLLFFKLWFFLISFFIRFIRFILFYTINMFYINRNMLLIEFILFFTDIFWSIIIFIPFLNLQSKFFNFLNSLAFISIFFNRVFLIWFQIYKVNLNLLFFLYFIIILIEFLRGIIIYFFIYRILRGLARLIFLIY